MGNITLPTPENNSGTNDWSDVYNNDKAIRDVVNGNLDNSNIKDSAAIAASKLALTGAIGTTQLADEGVTLAKVEDGTSGQLIVCDADGRPQYVTMSGDATISDAGALSIEDGAVEEDHIDSALAAKLGLADQRGYAEVLTEQTLTTGNDYTDLATVGPSVTVEVPAGGLVAVYASVEMSDTGANTQFVGLHEATDLPISGTDPGDPEDALMFAETATSTVFYSAPGSVGGTHDKYCGGWVVLQATEGTRTYKLVYAREGGTPKFKNRKLWVWTMGF